MTRQLLALLCLALFACWTPAFADAAAVKPPDLSRPDKSGEIGRELNYLCLRQLGADCRERLALGRPALLKTPFADAKPGQQMHEHQIRPIASLAFASATLLNFGKYDEDASGIGRQEMARIAVSLVRELASHHVSNTGKSGWWWGSEWQSAYWAAAAGKGAWLMWNYLPSDTREQVANMVVSEADRFLATRPPFGEFLDTKAEEVAWNSEILVLAACMMPDHPNRAAWEEKATEYFAAAFATPEDVKSEKLLDGKPMKDWVRGPNVHPDFSVENHGFFHPDYTTSYYLTIQNLPLYELAGKRPPEAIYHNVKELHDVLTFLTLPNGWTYYPMYTDWGNMRHDVTIMSQITNPVIPSRDGAACLRWGLDMLKYADSSNGSGLSQNLFRGLNFNCCPLETMTHVFLMHAIFGPGAEPYSDDDARAKMAGTRVWEQGKCVVSRSKNSIASFSWFDSGRRLMACVAPLAQDCVVLPKFRSLIGTIGGKVDEAKVTDRKVALAGSEGFRVGLKMQRGPEFSVKEAVAMLALGDHAPIMYAEWFENVPKDVEVRAGLVFFETNPYWLRGASAKVYYPGGVWEKPAPGGDSQTAPAKPVVLSGEDAQWLNLNDRLGILVRGSNSILVEDGQLVLNYKPAAAGNISPCTVVVFYPNATREATEQANRIMNVDGLGKSTVCVNWYSSRYLLTAEERPTP